MNLHTLISKMWFVKLHFGVWHVLNQKFDYSNIEKQFGMEKQFVTETDDPPVKRTLNLKRET